jgi:hypothetical protein
MREGVSVLVRRRALQESLRQGDFAIFVCLLNSVLEDPTIFNYVLQYPVVQAEVGIVRFIGVFRALTGR